MNMRGISIPVIVLLAMPLTLLTQGCLFSSDDNKPVVTEPAPQNWYQIIDLLAPGAPELEEVFALQAQGDSLGAAEALLAQLTLSPPLPLPHDVASDPVPLAEGLLGGTLQLIPHPSWSLPDDPDWNEDPFNDSNWRFQYHSMRWTLPLLQAFEQTGDDRYLDRLLFLIQDYADTNLNGSSADTMVWYDMSASLRAECWLTILRSLILANRLDVDLMISFLGWCHLHGEALYRDITYAAGNNHGSFHSRALMGSGLALPVFYASGYWFDRGYDRFQAQIIALVSPDGVYLEPSPFYHFFMMGTFRSVRGLILSSGLDLDDTARERLNRMPAFSARIIKPNGMLPMFSDCPSEIPLSGYRGISDELDFSCTAGESGVPPAERFRSYPVSGYTVFRSGWGQSRDFELETQVVFDVGPLGGWHGHHDGLSFTFSSWGSDLIVDTGYYTFEGVWRNHFLSPEAHNMVLPAEGWSGAFSNPQRLLWREADDWALQSGVLVHPSGALWTRTAVFLAPDDLLVLDRVSGGDPGALDQRFHFPPDASLQERTGGLTLENGQASLDLVQAWPAEMSTVRGNMDPIEGWYSERYGSKEPTSVARFRIEEESPRRYATLLHGHDGEDPLQVFQCLDDGDEVWQFKIERSSSVEYVSVHLETGEVTRSVGP